MTPELVTLDNVVVVSDGLTLVAEYRGKRFGLPARMIERGSTVRQPGDRGRLVIQKQLARDIGLFD